MEKLKERIIENSIDYILTGEYYIPDLVVEDEGYTIGRWGCMHRDYLKKKRPAIYSNMLLNGKLWKYLNDLDKQVEERFEILTKQMKQAEGVNEDLKKMNQIKWIQMSYNIQNRAEEIVRNELIY